MTRAGATAERGGSLAVRTLLICCALLGTLSCATKPAPDRGAQPRNDTETLDRTFEQIMARYRLPGLALGVIENGRIVYTRTEGERVAGAGERIDADTLFKIASNSKAMTTALLARLVDAGKLSWTDPVTRYLPGFRMYDPWVTREIQVRDLLIHNSGLRPGAGDLMLWPEPNSFTRADIVAGLAHLKPLHSFRSRYDYDNLLYVVAGEVAAAAGGASYEELVRRELFEPIGMTRCQAGTFERDRVGNVAQPHMRTNFGNVPVRTDAAVIPAMTSAAAGGIRCSLNDMLRWMSLWLDPSMTLPGGSEPWLTRAQRDVLWSAHMPMPLSDRQRRWELSRFNAYGYGWRVSDVAGILKVAHTGTLMGMYSAVALLPEKRSGFVFLINGEGSQARLVLTQLLLEYLTGREMRTVAQYADELAGPPASAPASAPESVDIPSAQIAPAEIASAPAPRRAASPDSMASLLGLYRDPWFGDVTICAHEGRVRFASQRSPQLTGTVMQAGERRLVDWLDDSVDAEAWLDFVPQPNTMQPTALTLAKVDPEADFSYDYEDLAFMRVGDCASGKEGATVQSQIDALMRDYGLPDRGASRQPAVPGASVLVLRDGVPIVRRSYGFADLEKRVLATPVTNYRLASVSKQFTAAAILLLAQDGRLSLDDLARKWLPSLPDASREVTIRHLLTHTSGLIDYEEVIPAGMTRQLHDADVLSILETQHRTYFPAGTSYRYSNSAYALLALIVERAAGKSFASFLRDRIFVPLGMTNTVAYEEGISTVPTRAYGYSHAKGAWVRSDQSQTSAVLGDGGIYSSIDDLARWDAALYDDRLLSADARRQAFTAATHTDDANVEYGFGWRITGETLWHSGETLGFRNVIVRYPQRRMSVVVLTNRDDPEPYLTALRIARIVDPGT